MGIEEYASTVIPVFFTLGSLGMLYPFFVEGFIIFSFVLLISLVLIGKFFEKVRLKGYFDIILASVSLVFVLSYFQRMNPLFFISGLLVLGFALYAIFIATVEIKCAL